MMILETTRLMFRLHEMADLDAYCEVMGDEEFRRLSGGVPLSRDEAAASLRSIIDGQQQLLVPKPMGLFATIYKPKGCYIGRCGVYPHRDDNGVIAPGVGVLGYYLARPYWGSGLATEAGRAFVEYGFGELGLTRIVAGANVQNVASHRVLEKLGFTIVRTGQGGGQTYRDYEIRNRPTA